MGADVRSISRRDRDRHLFDERPITLAGFTLRARGVDVVGRPTLDQWATAIDFAIGVEAAGPFWIGALWNYGEGRKDWRDRLEQALGELGRPLIRKTLINYGYIDRTLGARAKELAPTISHANAVIGLDPEEQHEFLEKARSEEMTVRDLTLEVKAARRRKVIDGQAILEGMYRVVYADPPWLYGDRPPSGSGAQQHYQGMSIDDLCKLPVEAHALPDSVLFMWTTSPIILQNPGPRDVIEAWGFEYKAQRIWDKVLHGFGYYVDVRHEILLICTRGSCLPDRPTPMLPSVVTERRSPEHSAKPESFRKDIERLYDGPYLELFGRVPIEGWSVFGNDARLWTEDAARSATVGALSG